MTGSEREDHLLRQLKAIAAMLARIAGLRESGAGEEARAELARAGRELLGSEAELVPRVDAASAAMLLGSPERIRAYARLLEEEAAQERDAERASFLRARAAEIDLEAARRAGTRRPERGG
jgi:hypothetical protein